MNWHQHIQLRTKALHQRELSLVPRVRSSGGATQQDSIGLRYQIWKNSIDPLVDAGAMQFAFLGTIAKRS